MYKLDKSKSDPNSWVITNPKSGVVIRFKEGEFNETQKVTVLDDVSKNANPFQLAASMARDVREMTDWLVKNHPEII